MFDVWRDPSLAAQRQQQLDHLLAIGETKKASQLAALDDDAYQAAQKYFEEYFIDELQE